VNTRVFRERLQRRGKRAGLTIPLPLAEQLETYYRLLATWNLKINLTGLDLREAADEAFDRLLIEPLVAAGHISPAAKSMLDIGSGGGSPAIPLKLARPDLALTMVEAKTRKSVFLREAVRELDLPAASVVTSRFEELLARPEMHEASDLVTLRAVRTEAKILVSLQAFLRVGGQLFLFRGQARDDIPEIVNPPLSWSATYPLVEPLRSRLVVLDKRAIGQGNSK
jgi:16S rRNA (guanine527-N7)-methyltransferase